MLISVSEGLYSSIQLSKFVAGLISMPAFDAISSLMIRIVDNKVDNMLFENSKVYTTIGAMFHKM